MPRPFRAGPWPAVPVRALSIALCAGLPALCLPLAPAPGAASETTRAAIRFDPHPAWKTADTLTELVAILETWLDAHSPLPARDSLPDIRIVPKATATALHRANARGHGRLRGLYDPERAEILLVAPWSAHNPLDVSILLHELVHHRQARVHHYCPAAQEPAAYRLQEEWLAERGLPLDWPRLAVTLAAGCTPRDIHP